MENSTEYLAPLSVIRLFETTKAERTSFVTQIIERAEQGTADPLEIHLQVKCMEDVVKQITSNDAYKGMVLDAAQKEGKSFTFHNAKFETKEAGTKYDYSQCGDPFYNSLSADIEMSKEKLKDREAFLKTVPAAGLEIVEGDEVIKVFPPSKTSTTTVAVTLK